MGLVIGAVGVRICTCPNRFPGVRQKLKVLVGGFLNIFVEDVAKNARGSKSRVSASH